MEYKKNQGYTLIELIVVIGMMLSITAVMVLNGADSRRLANLENAARQLESALMEAQAYGNSGRAFPPGESHPEDFDKGYGVYVTTSNVDDNNTKIFIYGGLGDLDIPEDGFDADEEKLSDFNHYTDGGQVYEVIQLEGSVVIDQVRGLAPPYANPNEGHVLFRRGQLQAGVYAPNKDLHGLEITLASGGFEKKVAVHSTGLIYIE